MSSTAKKRNPLKIVLKVLIVIICVAAIILAAVRAVFTIAYISFYNNSNVEFTIPGLNDGFVPQGLDYVEDKDVYITCGYASTSGNASMVYAIKADGTATKTELKNADGSNYTGHTGGIAYYKNYVYITGSTGCDVFSLSDILEGKASTNLLGAVNTPNDPAFCNIYNGKFYVGSFYRAGNYETPESHHIKTNGGETNMAIMTVYDLDDSADFYVGKTPTSVYSIPSLVQGMTFTKSGNIVLSTSYGLATSHLYVYDINQVTASKNGQFTFSGITDENVTYLNGTSVDLYFLDSTSLVEEISAPPMSEEIYYRDGKILIMTEAASNKYIFGKLTGAWKLYSLNYSD
jgi:hypothetical protein